MEIFKHTRVAYSFADFADIFGKSQTWTYRLYYKGKIKVIDGYGCRVTPVLIFKSLRLFSNL
tara:strand:+ start:4509 stop:4694 length:186 start_codon:yes stop_codon:yes gene_type:complete